MVNGARLVHRNSGNVRGRSGLNRRYRSAWPRGSPASRVLAPSPVTVSPEAGDKAGVHQVVALVATCSRGVVYGSE